MNHVVLFVDDQVIVGEALRRQLSQEQDISFHYCSDQSSIPSIIKREGVTVILQDLIMPGKDGIELIGWYQTLPEAKDIPVVLLSSNDDAKTKYRAFEAGANDYVVKFPEHFELIGRIRYHSRAYQALRERNRMLHELQLKSKLETLGRLAASVAHELNTPCQYLADNLSFLENRTLAYAQQAQVNTNDESYVDTLAAFKDCTRGVATIAEIIKLLQMVSEPASGPVEEIDVKKLTQEAVRELSSEPAIALVEHESPQCIITGYRSDLLHAITLLLKSALQGARSSVYDQAKVTLSCSLERGAVVISIHDNGTPLAEEEITRLEQLFFATHGAAADVRAQGLALSRAIIVDRHGGSLKISAPDTGGTMYTVVLGA
jgi:two-component system NtrC family sensor kinase